MGTCRCCGRAELPVNGDGACRLCTKQRSRVLAARPFPLVDIVEANRHGQQLWLADMIRTAFGPNRPPKRPRQRRVVDVVPLPITHRQLVLFDWPRDLIAANRTGFAAANPPLVDTLGRHVDDHAAANGWGNAHRLAVRRGTRIVLATQETPGNTVAYSELAALAALGISVPAVAAVLARAGMLIDDRQPPIIGWFARKTDGLPDAIRDELAVWFDVMRNGSTTPPRRRPRDHQAIGNQLRSSLPALHTWATNHTSLREITADDVRAVLPIVGSQRAHMLYGLRSIFTILKARQLVFTNPTARIHQPTANHPVPVAVDLATLRAALNSTDPACAAIAALLCFHAIRVKHLRLLHLTDIADGRLRLAGRTVLLAEQVRSRITAWLDHRNTTWPNTANAHLFINRRTATHTRPVHDHWCTMTLGLPAQMIRQDRILNEALATGGDLRQLAEMFGLSIHMAGIYADHAHHSITADRAGHPAT